MKYVKKSLAVLCLMSLWNHKFHESMDYLNLHDVGFHSLDFSLLVGSQELSCFCRIEIVWLFDGLNFCKACVVPCVNIESCCNVIFCLPNCVVPVILLWKSRCLLWCQMVVDLVVDNPWKSTLETMLVENICHCIWIQFLVLSQLNMICYLHSL